MKKLCSILLCLALILGLSSAATAATTAKFAVEPQFEIAYDFKDGLAAVKKNGLFGYIDKTGQMVIQPQFNEAGNFSEGLAAVAKDGYWHYIDKTGKKVITSVVPFDYGYSVADFKQGMAVVRKDGKYGYIDTTGRTVLEPVYFSADSFSSDGMASVCMKVNDSYKYGYINKAGNVVIQPQYDVAGSFYNGHAIVVNHISWKEKQIPMEMEAGANGQKEQAYMTFRYPAADRWSYIDTTGKAVITLPDVNIPDSMLENVFISSDMDGNYYYTVSGSMGGITQNLCMAGPFSMVQSGEELAVVRYDGKLGQLVENHVDLNSSGSKAYFEYVTGSSTLSYMNRKGEISIKTKFSEAKPFNEGLALVGDKKKSIVINNGMSSEGMWGFIGSKGQVEIEPQFIEATSFSGGYAAVKTKVVRNNGFFKSTAELWGYIDSKGKAVIESQFDEARAFSEGVAAVEKNGKWGYISGFMGTVDAPAVEKKAVSITKQQLAIKLIKLSGVEKEVTSNKLKYSKLCTFTDVLDAFKPYIGYAYSKGWIPSEAKKKFGVGTKVTEVMAAKAALKAAGAKPNDVNIEYVIGENSGSAVTEERLNQMFELSKKFKIDR